LKSACGERNCAKYNGCLYNKQSSEDEYLQGFVLAALINKLREKGKKK
jgi:hypothetical protein